MQVNQQKRILTRDEWVEMQNQVYQIEDDDDVVINVSHRVGEHEATKKYDSFLEAYNYIHMSVNKNTNFRITVEKKGKKKNDKIN